MIHFLRVELFNLKCDTIMLYIPYRIPNNLIQIAHGVLTCSYILICIIIVDPEWPEHRSGQ